MSGQRITLAQLWVDRLTNNTDGTLDLVVAGYTPKGAEREVVLHLDHHDMAAIAEALWDNVQFRRRQIQSLTSALTTDEGGKA